MFGVCSSEPEYETTKFEVSLGLLTPLGPFLSVTLPNRTRREEGCFQHGLSYVLVNLGKWMGTKRQLPTRR